MWSHPHFHIRWWTMVSGQVKYQTVSLSASLYETVTISNFKITLDQVTSHDGQWASLLYSPLFFHCLSIYMLLLHAINLRFSISHSLCFVLSHPVLCCRYFWLQICMLLICGYWCHTLSECFLLYICYILVVSLCSCFLSVFNRPSLTQVLPQASSC